MRERCLCSSMQFAAIWLIGCALAVRGGMLVAGREALRADPDDYRRLAENLVRHGTLGHGDQPTAFRPPLYPLLVAGCVVLGPRVQVSVGLLHLVAGLATVCLVYWMGRRWGLGRYAILGGVLVACDPILLAQSTLVMTETLATLLAMVAVAALSWAAEKATWRRAGVAGGCLGLAALCRPTFLPCALVAAVVLPLILREWPSRIRAFAGLAAGIALVLAPWAVRNQVQWGRPILTTSHGGYTLLLGNNPQFYEHLRSGAWGSVWDVKELEAARHQRLASLPPRTELQADRLAYEEALENIRREPGTFAYSCVVRMGRLWAPLPHQLTAEESALRRWSRYAVALWYAVELPLAAIGVVLLWRPGVFALPVHVGEASGSRANGGPPQSRPIVPGGMEATLTPSPPTPLPQGERGVVPRNPRGEKGCATTGWIWWVLLAAMFTAVHALFWTDMRMRAPLMPGVALAVAFTAGRIAEAIQSRNLLRRNGLAS